MFFAKGATAYVFEDKQLISVVGVIKCSKSSTTVQIRAPLLRFFAPLAPESGRSRKLQLSSTSNSFLVAEGAVS
jgi:hypothetical protein